MKLRDIVFTVLGIAFALICIRLGFWQISRLRERQRFNNELRARAVMEPVDMRALPADTGERHFRRVKVQGRYDFAHEFVLTNRTRNGSPGVNIITPLKIAGTDTAVLVNRGWVYAPDGMTVDLPRWRESGAVSDEGYVDNFSTGPGVAKSASHANAFRWMDRPTFSQAIPYPLSSWFVVLIPREGRVPENVPPRVEVPPLDEGQHRSYAIQWFSFAAISIFGTILYLRRK